MPPSPLLLRLADVHHNGQWIVQVRDLNGDGLDDIITCEDFSHPYLATGGDHAHHPCSLLHRV